jgi:hypothetical protein
MCEIFTHDGLGSFRCGNSKVIRGKPALCGWLVMAIAITVSERRLKISWLGTSTGRRPACSRPRSGLKSAQ